MVRAAVEPEFPATTPLSGTNVASSTSRRTASCPTPTASTTTSAQIAPTGSTMKRKP